MGATTTSAGTLLQVFGNHSDGRLWTVTQSAPGTAAEPTGTWDVNSTFDLGPALVGLPTAVANADGRLAVFGVNANRRVTEFLGPWHLHMAPCVPGDTTQQWYLDPVTPTTTAGPTAYRIVQVSSGTCLTALDSDPLVERIDCRSTDPNHHNTWLLGRGEAVAPGVLNLALARAAQQCAADPNSNTCTFVDASTPSAYRASQGCVVGSVLFNDGVGDAKYTASWTRTTGSEWSVAGTVEWEPSDKITLSFTASHSWIEESSTTESVEVTVAPKQFGWVEYTPVVRETIGYWKIVLGTGTWTVPGHNISVAKPGTNGARDFWIAKSSGVPPTGGHCDR
ncbi:hypothetical protein [Streptomyces sp. NBC_01429]|uniref:hypothetical protein n=1 Tax=Streptomyces sp. NBC_01429 TaxID=2903862 RepID=UPI002E2AACE2|nr:hypothetical protein [Streptomyces sp. NBC_01429]